MNVKILGLGFAVLLAWLGSRALHLTGGFWAIVAFVALVVTGMKALGIGREIATHVPVAGQLNPTYNLVLLIGSLAVLGMVGAVNYDNLLGGIGGTQADITGKAVSQSAQFAAPGIVSSVAQCIEQAKKVNPDNVGKAATITVNYYDLVAANPFNAAVDVNPTVFYKNGDLKTPVATSTDTSAYSLTGFNVGDVLYAYSGGTSYYADSIEGLCVDTTAFPVKGSAYTIPTEANMQSTIYADSGSSNELSAGTASEDDYTVALGANQKEDFYYKLKTNVANKAFRLGGIGTLAFYNISSVYVTDSAYQPAFSPTFMKNIDVKVNETGTATTISKTYTLYKLSTPLVLKNWESKETRFLVETDSTKDPDGGGGTSSFDGFGVMAFDSTYAQATDGSMIDDVYQHVDAQSDVGLSQTVASPLGKTMGALVEST